MKRIRNHRSEPGQARCVGATLVLLGIASLLASGAAVADVDPLPMGEEAIVFQEIPSVYGASKFEQKVTEAPSFVTLITASAESRTRFT